MKKLAVVDQITYDNWNDALQPGHENYWVDVSNLANILENCLSRSDYSSIQVSQVKEKFGRVRAYISFADIKKVKRLYRKKLKFINLANEKIRIAKALPINDRSFWQKNLVNQDEIQKISFKDFSKECLLSDMRFYRSVYYDLASLVPHYKNVLFDDADYRELLFDTKDEMEKHVKDNNKFYKNDLEIIRKVYEK